MVSLKELRFKYTTPCKGGSSTGSVQSDLIDAANDSLFSPEQ